MRVFSIFPALVLTLSLIPAALPLAAAAHEHNPQCASPAAKKAAVYTATGTIVMAEKTAETVAIRHDPVPALNWPAMTMNFRLEDPSLADGLKKGDAVRFDFLQVGAVFTIVDMEPLN
ncbi:MAG: copper-binding protein [Desulfovibrio sp.]|jgi:Cu(I)/Ag(I) efflux system protein CusF|nr:copper-binding protein [Desulfovibrio sp.]